MSIRSTIACNLDTHILQAALPLFEQGRVQGLEWSFDALYLHNTLPNWFGQLLKAYASQGRLVGHGVFFPIFAGRWTDDHQQWLANLKTLSATYAFDHITEHFGCRTGADFHTGAPLGVPFTAATLALGIDRLKRIQQAAGCPVGLENLAFAYTPADVERHGNFLLQLIEPINGFLILDLHNLYCQSHNFDVPPDQLLTTYPLHRVREIHISGGSWSDSESSPGQRIRRDTHDDRVPEDVFALLSKAIPACANLRYVVLEQLGSGLTHPESQLAFREDFLRMDAIVQEHNQQLVPPVPVLSFLPDEELLLSEQPPQDLRLQAQQDELSAILESAADHEQARAMLNVSGLAESAWEVERWPPAMLETALAIAQKWRNGFG